jgi:hypothetical protein
LASPKCLKRAAPPPLPPTPHIRTPRGQTIRKLRPQFGSYAYLALSNPDLKSSPPFLPTHTQNSSRHTLHTLHRVALENTSVQYEKVRNCCLYASLQCFCIYYCSNVSLFLQQIWAVKNSRLTYLFGMQPPEMWLGRSCGLQSDVYRSAHLHPALRFQMKSTSQFCIDLTRTLKISRFRSSGCWELRGGGGWLPDVSRLHLFSCKSHGMKWIGDKPAESPG